MVLELPVIAVAGTIAIWIGSNWLEPAAAGIARAFNLPSLVHGAILVAAASSFPELASVVLSAVRYGEFELGVATIVGSAIFNVLVIPAVAVFVASPPIDSSRELVYKDAQFYFLSVVVTFMTFALAVVYVPVDVGTTGGEMTRPLALIPLGLYVIYLGIHYLEVSEGEPFDDDAFEQARTAAFGFIGGMVLILLGVEGLLYVSTELGAFFGTPSYLWGLTVVAIGTSLPDLLISVKAARADRPLVSISNVFGSNVFDLLVAIPAGVIIAGSTTVRFDRAVPMFAFLVGATILAMVTLRTDLALTRREGAALLGLYGGFVGWMVLESVGLLSIL